MPCALRLPACNVTKCLCGSRTDRVYPGIRIHTHRCKINLRLSNNSPYECPLNCSPNTPAKRVKNPGRWAWINTTWEWDWKERGRGLSWAIASFVWIVLTNVRFTLESGACWWGKVSWLAAWSTLCAFPFPLSVGTVAKCRFPSPKDHVIWFLSFEDFTL